MTWLMVAVAVFGWRGAVGLATIAGARRLVGRIHRSGDPQVDTENLALLVVVGVSAGMVLSTALDAAGSELGGATEAAVGDLLRRARSRGFARALAETEGPLSELAGQLAKGIVTGAPAVSTLSAFLEDRRSRHRGVILEQARTLPVRLIIPVALLLLPGFVALVVGPFVVDQVSGLIGSIR